MPAGGEVERKKTRNTLSHSMCRVFLCLLLDGPGLVGHAILWLPTVLVFA